MTRSFSQVLSPVFNTKVYGSDATGTLAGNDSIVLAGNTVQTSTVYGGAGSDTLIIGNYSTPADAQLLKIDVQGFAGDDSIQFRWILCFLHPSKLVQEMTPSISLQRLDPVRLPLLSSMRAQALTRSKSLPVKTSPFTVTLLLQTLLAVPIPSKSLVSLHRPFMALQVATL